MGLLGAVVWDIEFREPILVRLVRGGMGPEQMRDVLLKFSSHCDSMQGVAKTPEEVMEKWDPPPRIVYTVVPPKFRVIIVWSDSEPTLDAASDADNALHVLADAVKANTDALLAASNDKVYFELYKASGEALLLGELKLVNDISDPKKKSTIGGIAALNVFGLNRSDKEKEAARSSSRAAAKPATASKAAPKAVEPAAADNKAQASQSTSTEAKPKSTRKLLFGLGRSKSKKGAEANETASRESAREGTVEKQSSRSLNSSQKSNQDAPAQPEVQPAALPKSFLDSSDDEPEIPTQAFDDLDAQPTPPNIGAAGAVGPPPPLVREMNDMAIVEATGPDRQDLLNRVGELMTKGDFPAALATARQAIGAGKPEPKLALAVFYTFGLELILRIRIAESQPEAQRNLMGIAFLSSALADLPLLPRQRTGARLMAAQKHMMVGNYGLASVYAQSAMPDADPDQHQKISQVVMQCRQHGETNSRVPASAKLCFKTFSTLGSPFVGCGVCPASFSLQTGLSEGQQCLYCPFGTVRIMRD